ncbi:MAG: hypothetical protein K2L22_04660 [Muribaculaceae bacterium]|nr:hypothetical protein [Muribaculaceae bacterium]
MKRTLLFSAILTSLLAFSSCSEDTIPRMIWEFYDYDSSAVSAGYSHDFDYRINIIAVPDYEGSITLKCKNYGKLDIVENSFTGSPEYPELGYSVTKIDDKTIKVSFRPVESYNKHDSGYVQIDGVKGNITNWNIISICRATR